MEVIMIVLEASLTSAELVWESIDRLHYGRQTTTTLPKRSRSFCPNCEYQQLSDLAS